MDLTHGGAKRAAALLAAFGASAANVFVGNAVYAAVAPACFKNFLRD